MMFRNVTLLLAFSWFFLGTAISQTLSVNEQKLETAVKIYNGITSSVNDLHSGSARLDSEISAIEIRIKEAEVLLNQITSPETENLEKTVRYFRNNLQYQHGYMFGLTGNMEKMIELLAPCSEFFENTGSSYFPLKYSFEGKSFSIKYENFEYTRGVYFSAVTEGYVTLKLEDKAILAGRPGVPICKDAYTKALLINNLNIAKFRVGQFDQEMVDYSLEYMTAFLSLEKEDQTRLDSFNLGCDKAWSYLTKAIEKNPAIGDQGVSYSRAAALLVRANEKELSAQAYQKALDAGYSEKNFLFEVARSGVYSSRISKGRACDMLSASGNLSCSEMEQLSNIYKDLGNSSQAEALSKKAKKCSTQALKMENRSNGGGFHLYLGTYPLRYLGHKNYRDYGAVLGFTAGKFMMNASYMIVNKNLYAWTDMSMQSISDKSSDKYYWSGEQIDVAFRFSPSKFERTRTQVYFGPQFGYSNRKLSDIHSDVTNPVTNTTEYGVVFNPIDQQYQLALNIGQFVGGKGVGMDFNFSVGGSYCNFDLNKPAYDLDNFTFSHGYLDNRTEWHWGIVLRLNFTVGLYL